MVYFAPGWTYDGDSKEELIATANIRVNERIRAREVRVIDDIGTQLGIMPPYQALKTAKEQNLDLVEVDRKSTRLNSSHSRASRMPSSA